MINNKESQKKEVLVVFVRAGFNFNEKQVLITSVSSSEHSYLQFTFDFMTLTQNFNISYFEQKRKSYFSESLD